MGTELGVGELGVQRPGEGKRELYTFNHSNKVIRLEKQQVPDAWGRQSLPWRALGNKGFDDRLRGDMIGDALTRDSPEPSSPS